MQLGKYFVKCIVYKYALHHKWRINYSVVLATRLVRARISRNKSSSDGPGGCFSRTDMRKSGSEKRSQKKFLSKGKHKPPRSRQTISRERRGGPFALLFNPPESAG